MHKHLRILLLVILSLASFIKGYGQTPVPMTSQTLTSGVYSYTENFSDIANWTANFASGTGANRFRSVPITTTGAIPDGVKTTYSTATFSTSTSGGVQKGTGNLVFLATGSSPESSTALAVDFLVDFTSTTAGTLSFDWQAIANSTGNRASTLNVYTSPDDGATFTQLTLPAALTNIINNGGASGSVTSVQLPTGLNNVAHAVIRFYLYNGTGGGTAPISGSRPKVSIDNLTVTATPTSNADNTPPVTTANYPKTGNITTTSVDFTNNLNEAGTTYYEALASTATAPSAAQIKAGQDASGATVTLSGSFAVAANTDVLKTISGLTPSTSYKIYSVSQDAAGNLQNAISTSAVTTLTPADVTPPVTTANYPKTGNITSTAVDLTNNLNEVGTTYYVVLPSTATTPSVAQVKAGQDASGAVVTISGSFAITTANTDATKTISGLTASTTYSIYTVSQDASANLQTTVATTAFTTLAPPFANISSYPKTANVTATTVDLLSDLNANGTTYYVVLPTAATAPTAAQVLAGQDGSGAAASQAGSFAVTANTAATLTITGLTPTTGYKIYVASKSTDGTQQTTLSTLSATTAIQYFASYPFTGVTAPNASSNPPVVGTGTTDPTPVPTATGITFGSFTSHNSNATQPNAGGRFSFTNWPTGATNGSDVFTQSIDPTQYYEVTITPQTNKLTLTAINFTIQRSSTGVRQYAVRSSLDNFASNLPASVDPTAASALSVVTGNTFQITDATTTATPGNIITLGSTYTDLTTPVTFRFYGFNAEAVGGTFSIDDVNFLGSVGGPITIAAAPVNTAGYPKANNITNTSVNLVSNLNETGTTYYVLIPTGGTAPTTVAQIKAGTDGAGNAAFKAGTINITAANTDASTTINGLTQATGYNIYAVSQDASATPNVQTAFVNIPFTTTGDTPKTDQHITLAATASATYGASDIDPAATSDNPTIPIIYSSSDVTVATIVANKVHIVKAGTVTITANQAGNATYDPATAQTQILTIAPKAITVIAAAATKIYGDADPAFTYTTNTVLVGTDAFTGSLTRATGETVNTYAITQGTLALNSNYTITYTSANLTITPKALTVIAAAKTKIYGDADPAFTYTTSAALVGTDAFTGSLARVAGEAVGTYAINQGTLALSNNYTVTYTGANLTITPKVLTVTADNQTKLYGAANPTLTITYSGFANGDTQASLTTAATATTTANAASTIGNYDIIPAGAVGSNYTFNYVNGKLTVVSNSRVLTFNSLPSKTYGDADFNPNATLSSGETPIYTTSDANVATIVNGNIHIVGAGNVTITATAPVNPDYGVTQPISQLLSVNKANQTITFAAIPNLLSGATYSLSAVTSSSGLPVTFTVDDPFVARVQGTTLNALTLGTATVIASAAANANYNAANASQKVTVGNVNGDELYVHQAVSPNGDGINDYLFIEGIQDHPVNKVTIVNGVGIKVFEVNNYSNTNSNTVFNGRSNVNGQQQVAGTYFYLIELNDGGKLHRKTGYFLLKY